MSGIAWWHEKFTLPLSSLDTHTGNWNHFKGEKGKVFVSCLSLTGKRQRYDHWMTIFN